MTALLLLLRRVVCRILGHRFGELRDDTGILIACKRCGGVRAYTAFPYTMRRKVTNGDIEQRMAAYPPDGYSFVSVNWKKRKAKFVTPNGRSQFVAF